MDFREDFWTLFRCGFAEPVLTFPLSGKLVLLCLYPGPYSGDSPVELLTVAKNGYFIAVRNVCAVVEH